MEPAPCFRSSNLFIDGLRIVNNDYPQSATERCGDIQLNRGIRKIYIEGWSRSEFLSIFATYQGPDSQNTKIAIPGFWECYDPALSQSSSNFLVCGYNVAFTLDITNIAQIYTYYNQVKFL